MFRGRRRRRALHRPIEGLTKPALRRLVKRIDDRICISGHFYEELRGVIKEWLEQVVHTATAFICKDNLIRVAHVRMALKHAPGDDKFIVVSSCYSHKRTITSSCLLLHHSDPGISCVHNADASCRRQWLRAIWRATRGKGDKLGWAAKDSPPHARLLAFFAFYPGSMSLFLNNRHTPLSF